MEKVRAFIQKQRAKNELIQAFTNMGLYKTYKSGNGKEFKNYPKIHSVKFNQNDKSIEYVFTLLNGLDPKVIHKHDYVLNQHFGRNVKVDGEYKKFTLTVYETDMDDDITYDYSKFIEDIKSFKLPIICGVDRYGRYKIIELIKQPHILIAGETGSGKSTQLRSLITTLIQFKKPKELLLYLADCKKQEFHIFRKVEHVQCVVSSVKDIKKMLNHIHKELEKRSDLTELFEVDHIDDLPEEHRLPYIIVCIDEFVMLRKDDEIMNILIELVAIGRTLGVFAILSMQRPSSKVLDTTIRANLTVSMGFKLRDKSESRITNTPGSEKIEVNGRFIMNSDKIYELQAPYLKMEEAKKILNSYMVAKEDIKEVNEVPEEPKAISEEDVFIDAIDAPR